MLCHGSGDAGRGCCYVNGQVCPLRWRITDGHVYDANDVDLGTVDDFVNAQTANGAARRRAKDQLEGVTFVCSAAVRIIRDNPAVLTDRDVFNTAWDNDPAYVEQVRPHWQAVELSLGLEPGSYQCSTWRGVGVPQCCFAETPEENAAKAANLPAAARQVRQAGGT